MNLRENAWTKMPAYTEENKAVLFAFYNAGFHQSHNLKQKMNEFDQGDKKQSAMRSVVCQKTIVLSPNLLVWLKRCVDVSTK